jgi:hypothetical protein
MRIHTGEKVSVISNLIQITQNRTKGIPYYYKMIIFVLGKIEIFVTISKAFDVSSFIEYKHSLKTEFIFPTNFSIRLIPDVNCSLFSALQLPSLRSKVPALVVEEQPQV